MLLYCHPLSPCMVPICPGTFYSIVWQFLTATTMLFAQAPTSSSTGGSRNPSPLLRLTIVPCPASIPKSGPTCTSRPLQCCPLSPGHLTNNVCRRSSVFSPAGMDLPAGLSHPKAEEPMLNIGRNSAVYPLGTSSSQRSTPSMLYLLPRFNPPSPPQQRL